MRWQLWWCVSISLTIALLYPAKYYSGAEATAELLLRGKSSFKGAAPAASSEAVGVGIGEGRVLGSRREGGKHSRHREKRLGPKSNETRNYLELLHSRSLYNCDDRSVACSEGRVPLPQLTHAEHSVAPPIGYNLPTVDFVLTAETVFTNVFDLHYEEGGAPETSLKLSDSLDLPEERRANLTRLYGYDGKLPGPVIRVPLGHKVHLALTNKLPEDTSFRVNGHTMEGLTFIAPGDTATYTVLATVPGTFLYGPGVAHARQAHLGLGGMFIVDEDYVPKTYSSAAAAMKKENEKLIYLSTLIIDPSDWQVPSNFEFGPERAYVNRNGRHGNVVLINGASTSAGLTEAFALEKHQRVRILNGAGGRTFELNFIGDLSVEDLGSLNGVGSTHYEKESVILAAGQSVDLRVALRSDEGSPSVFLQSLPYDSGYNLDVIKKKRDMSAADAVLLESFASSDDGSDARTVELVALPVHHILLADGGKRQNQDKEADTADGLRLKCENGRCDIAMFGFNLTGAVPEDAEVEDVSLLFEVECDDFAHRSFLEVLVGSFGSVNSTDGKGLYMDVRPYIIKRTECGGESVSEIAVDLRSEGLSYAVQRFVNPDAAAAAVTPPEGVSAVPAQGARAGLFFTAMTFRVSESAGDHLWMSSSTSESLPPTTIRIVYRTKQIMQTTKKVVPSRRNLLVRKRRLDQVYAQLAIEQKALQAELQRLYESVKKRSLRTRRGKRETVHNEVRKMETSQDLIGELSDYVKDQHDESSLERSIELVRRSDMPESAKKTVIEGLQEQLQLRQSLQLLQGISLNVASDDKQQREVPPAQPPRPNNQPAVSRMNVRRDVRQASDEAAAPLRRLQWSTSALRHRVLRANAARTDAGQRQSPAIDIFERTLLRDKERYMQMYDRYHEIVGEMRHLKATSLGLADRARHLHDGPANVEDGSVRFRYAPAEKVEEPSPLLLFYITPVPSDADLKIAAFPRTYRSLLPLTERTLASLNAWKSIVRQSDGKYLEQKTKMEPYTVKIKIQQADQADASGDLPMWLKLQQRGGPSKEALMLEPLSAATPLLLEVSNTHPCDHPLSFQGIVTMPIDRETVYLNGTVRLTRYTKALVGTDFRVPGTHSEPQIEKQVVHLAAAFSTRGILTEGTARSVTNLPVLSVQSTIPEFLGNGLLGRYSFRTHSEASDVSVDGLIDLIELKSSALIFSNTPPKRSSRTRRLLLGLLFGGGSLGLLAATFAAGQPDSKRDKEAKDGSSRNADQQLSLLAEAQRNPLGDQQILSSTYASPSSTYSPGTTLSLRSGARAPPNTQSPQRIRRPKTTTAHSAAGVQRVGVTGDGAFGFGEQQQQQLTNSSPARDAGPGVAVASGVSLFPSTEQASPSGMPETGNGRQTSLL